MAKSTTARRLSDKDLDDPRADNPDHREAFHALLRAAVRADLGRDQDQRTSAPPKPPR
jgi:hypothetical protein